MMFILVFTAFSSLEVTGQTTYTWDGSESDNLWSTAANWTPDRNTPAASDIIQFNTGTSIEILGVPFGHYITMMSVTNNTNVTLKPGTTLNVDGEIYVTAGDDNALYVESGSTLTIAGRDITGTDENILMFNLAASPANIGATIEGTLRCGLDNNNLSAHGMIQRKGTTQLFNFMDGSVYEQAINGGYIPFGTWAEGSSCLITGVTVDRPLFRLNDVYADVIWNCPFQTGIIDLGGNLRTIGGDLTVISTGSSRINFGAQISSDITINGNYIQQGGSLSIAPSDPFFPNLSRKMTVMGDFTLTAGTFWICRSIHPGILEVDGKFTSSGDFYFHVSGANASATINANGDVEISGGTFNMSSANSSLGVMNVKGNFSHTGGTITESGLAGDIVFNGTEVQTFSSTGGTVTNMINFSVNSGAFLQMADEGTIITSGAGGTFTLNTNGTLGIKSPFGIETSGSAGHIQTPERYFNEGADYVYNGSSAQVTGSGLTQNIPAGLEINNSAGVTLSGATEISGLLKMTSGTLDLVNTSFTAGSLTGSSDITNSTGTPADVIVTIGSDNTSVPYSGVISNGTANTVALVKTGDGTALLSGTNTYTGPTTISGGVLELGSATTINDNSEIVLNGGTLSTGSGAGFSETAGALSLLTSSNISLGSGSHTLNFAPTDGTGWQTGEVLTIYGWSGQAGSSGTEGKIIFGSNETGLDPTLLGAINFNNYGDGADILSNGEIVPHSETQITISSPDPAVPDGNILQTTQNNIIYRLDISVTNGNTVITSLQATLSGTLLSADLTNLKAWYSTDNTFTTEDILLSTIVSSGPGLHAFTPWTNQEITSGTTGYIFITADVPCEAETGHTVYVNAMTASDITFIAGNIDDYTSPPSPGGTQTIVYGFPESPVNPAASLAVSQTSLSWSDPACFDEIMIAGKEGSAVGINPSGDGTSYTDDLNFGSGTEFDGGYIVYKGASSPQTVTGLQNEVTYYFTFFSRRGTNWSPGATVSVTPVANSGLSFQTAASGNWASASIWEMSYDNGLSWIQAAVAPDSSYGPVTIRNGHSITVTSELNIDQTTIEAGATVISSAVLKIADDNPLGCEVYGTLQTITDGGTIYANYGLLEFKDGGTYTHNRNGGAIPSATWSAGSNCNITGVTNGLTFTSLNQSLGNFTWNCPGQNANLSIRGYLNDIKGNFSVVSTGTLGNYIRLGAPAAATLTVGGNFIQTGGIISLTPEGQFTMSITGDFSLSTGGQLNMSSGTALANGVINVAGDFTLAAGGVLYETTSLNPGGLVVFNGSGDQQVFVSGGIVAGAGPGTDGIINFTVNSGAYLQMAEASTTITGAGTFTLSSGATLGITSADGITTTGGLTGNIRTTGGRVYSDEANYIYNGTGSQVSGNGLPLEVNSLLLSGTTDFTLTNGAAKNAPFTIAQNLEIAADAVMTVSPLQAVTVGNDLVNDGNLDLESDASGIASLMINGDYSGEGNAKSEIFMTGGDAGTDMWRWHYFAVPSQQSSVSLAGVYGLDIMNYTDVTGMTDKSEGWNWYDGWDGTTAFTNLNVTEGYAYYNDNPVTMELNSGSLPSSLGTVNLNYGTYGWNLLGNSLTCGLNWDACNLQRPGRPFRIVHKGLRGILLCAGRSGCSRRHDRKHSSPPGILRPGA